MQTTVGNAREIPPTSPRRAAEVATAELDAELLLLGTLDEQDWRRPTDGVGWDVHDLTAHLVGEYEEITRRGCSCAASARGRRLPVAKLFPEEARRMPDAGLPARGVRPRRSPRPGGRRRPRRAAARVVF